MDTFEYLNSSWGVVDRCVFSWMHYLHCMECKLWLSYSKAWNRWDEVEMFEFDWIGSGSSATKVRKQNLAPPAYSIGLIVTPCLHVCFSYVSLLLNKNKNTDNDGIGMRLTTLVLDLCSEVETETKTKAQEEKTEDSCLCPVQSQTPRRV